ncbi:hypothetical protein N1851_014313 [Merluccius polli]|uniref:CCHC-type domain-containing protein n=1 Tax=Merluccius polli TaxID=89951 RepID=A0AA47MUH3_MERPO|nr:hypothetical protein N1851_014313 [Merluccius polli]
MEEYSQSLHEPAKMCAFGQMKNEYIRDRFVIGVLDKDLSQKLQMVSDLTLKKACSVSTAGKTDTKPDGRSKADREGVEKDSKKVHLNLKGGTGENIRVLQDGETCTIATQQLCRKCGKTGHYATVCRTVQISNVSAKNAESESDESENKTLFLGAITGKDSTELQCRHFCHIRGNLKTVNETKADHRKSCTGLPRREIDEQRKVPDANILQGYQFNVYQLPWALSQWDRRVAVPLRAKVMEELERMVK